MPPGDVVKETLVARAWLRREAAVKVWLNDAWKKGIVLAMKIDDAQLPRFVKVYT